MLQTAYKALDDKFATDIVALDIQQASTIADYFIIATGGSPNQIHAMCNELIEKLSQIGVHLRHSEGSGASEWTLLDFGDLIVHIFSKEGRSFYNLERIWGDAKALQVGH